LSLLRQRNRVRPQRAIMALTALLILAHAAVSGFVLARFRAHVLHDAAAELDNFGRSAGIAVGRSLFAASAVSFGVSLAVAALPPAAALDEPAIGALLRRFREQGSPFCTILLVDADGRLANAAGPAPAAMRNYAASPFFAAHLRKNAPSLFVGLTPGTLPGGRSLIVSRPLYRGGRFAGVVAVAVPRAALADILQAVVGRTGVAAQILLDRDVVVAAEPRRPGAGGRGVAVIKAFAGARESGRARASAAVSAGERQGVLYNVRTLAAFPVSVAMARPRADILRRWKRALVELLAGFGVFAATAVTLAGLIVRALNRREQAARELQRSEAQSKRQGALLQSTLESMAEGLSVFDRNGRLVAWNRRFCELLGLSSVALGMSLREILMQQAVRGDFGAVVPEVEVEKRIAEFYQTPQTKERVTPDGRVLQIRRTAMPDGAVLTIYSDITDLKNSERRLIEARCKAEAANQAKSEFLANMSHELRTPLNAVIGFSEVIKSQLFGPLQNHKYLEYIKDIHSSSLHLLSIINDVLDISKIEAGKLDLSRQPLRLQSVAAAALRILHEQASSRRITLIPELAAQDVVIRADERAIKQVFLNLLSNAIKFSHEGGAVHLRVARDEAGAALVEVEDHGIGMTAEEQRRALEPFGQAQTTTARNYGGTGLGLPIAKGLVEAHGGRLTIASRPGQGTIVRLMLPGEQTQPPARALQPQDTATG
jgi:PAS domain S-box-containing protein